MMGAIVISIAVILRRFRNYPILGSKTIIGLNYMVVVLSLAIAVVDTLKMPFLSDVKYNNAKL